MSISSSLMPLTDWPLADRLQVRGVMTDIDDTLTRDGHIMPEALEALHRLKNSGLAVIAITGRSTGWCAPFAAQWPVDAMVAETGAVAFVNAAAATPARPLQGQPQLQPQPQPQKIYLQDEATRVRNYQVMQQVIAQVEREVPGAKAATDSWGRECDIAIDHSEFARLTAQEIGRVVAIMRAAGMHATVSSIHVNGYFGNHNKWSGAQWIVRELFGRDLRDELRQWVFVGDSRNDESMFAQLGNSFGVANIARFAAELTHKPRYITPSPQGLGFAEMATALLQAREAAA